MILLRQIYPTNGQTWRLELLAASFSWSWATQGGYRTNDLGNDLSGVLQDQAGCMPEDLTW